MQQPPRHMSRTEALLAAICTRPAGDRVLLAGPATSIADVAAKVRALRPDLEIVLSSASEEVRGHALEWPAGKRG